MPKRKEDVIEKVYYIYKIHFLLGFPSGRCYIGKHYGYINDRYTGSGDFCKRYFKKYKKILGVSYIKEILEINPDFTINTNREIFLIGDLWKTDPLCMNLKPGGDGNESLSEENKHKIAEVNKKPVTQYTLTGELITSFDSAKSASEITGVCCSKITSCCTKNRLTAGKYIWRYIDDPLTKDELVYINNNAKLKSASKCRVVQVSKDGTKTEYESIRCASKITGVSNGSITEVCKGKRKSAGGFVWKYKED